MTTLTFHRIEALDASTWPSPRQGHASVCHSGYLYIFGGRVQGSGRIYVNDLWKYDPLQCTWEELVTVDPSHMPCKRHNHSCVVEAGAIYVFGGQTDLDAYLGDLWRFDLSTRQWSQLATSQPRHSHSALKHGRSMVVFGGRTGLKPAVYSSEILVYDFDCDTWTSLYSNDGQNSVTIAPHPRSYTPIVQAGPFLVVYGGYWWNGQEHYFDDTFGFCLSSYKWVKLSPLANERVPHSRNRHGVLPLPTNVGSMSGIIIFGGNFYSNREGTDTFFDDAWLFGSPARESLVSGKWSKVTLLGDIPCPRGHHSWVEDDQAVGRSWMFGGEANRQRFNDLYEIRIEAPPA